MKPFVLKQHEKDNEIVRELRETEIPYVAGGYNTPSPGDCVTSTPNSDGGKDHNDG